MNETTMHEPQVKAEFNQAREAASLIPRSATGIEAQNLAQQLDVAKYIAAGGFMIPKHFRGNVGAVLLAMDLADRWGFSAVQVIRMIYEVNGQMGMMGQLVHAIIEKFAPLQTRLKITFDGQGETRVCIVSGRFKNEADDCEYRSPPFKDIQPKNSPLWKTDPDQQQSYLSVSRWARRFSPATLMGIYSKEELEDAGAQYIGPDQAKDITPASLHERLMAAGRGEDGFHDGVVEVGLNGHPAPATAQSSAPADAGASQVQASALLNSSQGAPQQPETEPAPEGAAVPSVAGAGNSQSTVVASVTAPAVVEERQATEPGASALDGSGGLPGGWEIEYAKALGKATKPHSLDKYATAWWAPHGGWVAHKSGPNGATAQAIYDAFANNFGEAGKEARDVILHELGAA